MKKTFVFGLLIAYSFHVDALNLNNTSTMFKIGQFCGNCDGSCKEKPGAAA